MIEVVKNGKDLVFSGDQEIYKKIKSRSVIPWVGGKFRLAEFIVKHFPKHNQYTELFAGGLSVFFYKEKSQVNYINDINNDLINAYNHLRDNTEKIANWMYLTLSSESNQQKYYNIYSDKSKWNNLSEIDRARIYLFLIKLSYNAYVLNYYQLRSNLTSQYSREFLTIILASREKLYQAYILNRDFRELLSKSNIFDHKESLIYADPPYYITTENKSGGSGAKYYSHNFTWTDHLELNKLIKEYKYGMFVISYDDVPQIRELYNEKDGFTIIETPEMFQSSAVTTDNKGFSQKEILILKNINIKDIEKNTKQQEQQSIFDI